MSVAPNSRAERDPVRVAAEDDDPLRAQPLRGDHPAQPDGAVADDGHRLARARRRRARRRGARCRSRRRASAATASAVVLRRPGSDDQRAVGERHAHRLALAAVDPSLAVEAAVQAGRVEPLVAEDAGAVRPRERRDDEIAALTLRTSEPTSSTTPMNSWPIRRPGSRGSSGLYGQRSCRRCTARVTRTSASVGSMTLASGTVSMRTSPAPYMTVARISTPPRWLGSWQSSATQESSLRGPDRPC